LFYTINCTFGDLQSKKYMKRILSIEAGLQELNT
jgi:hypothetical protein